MGETKRLLKTRAQEHRNEVKKIDYMPFTRGEQKGLRNRNKQHLI